MTTELLQEAFDQPGLSIDNGSTAFDFVDEEFLRNCEHFLPDPIEIPSNEKIEAYPFLKYKFSIKNLRFEKFIYILFTSSLLRTY